MAIDFSKLNFFSRLNARSRVAVLVGGVIGLVLLIYFGTRFFSGGDRTTGPSRVATVPSGVQSVQGGQLTPEYYRALMQANTQAAQQAQISGTSAINTLVNVGQGAQSCIICSDQNLNVKNLLDDWLRQGQISPDVANALNQLAAKNVPVSEYAAELDRLVREGKLTPEQARALLEQYKKQHGNALLNESAKTMDAMIKSGQLPLDVANHLLELQKKGVSPSEYAAELQRLVREGKLSPEAARQLLAQYTQQRAKEIIMRSIATLQQWSAQGQITPDVLQSLVKLEQAMVPLDNMSTTLQDFVNKGQLTPAVAKKILDEYKEQKSEIGSTSTIQELIRQAEAAAFAEISDLLKTGKISPETAAALTDMIQKNVPLDAFKAAVMQMVQTKQLTPEIAQLKIGDYTRVKTLRDEAERLANLQANNVSPGDYANELKKAVAAGLLTPDQAAQLMQEYQGMLATPEAVTPLATGAGSEQFAALQQRVQGAPTDLPAGMTAEDFAASQAQATVETDQDRQNRIQSLVSAMSGQAQQLVAAWQPPVMQGRVGTPDTSTTVTKTTTSGSDTATVNKSTSGGDVATGASLIKAGSILFAVLDTAVNSDYPDSPVMATIVQGPLKGAKLLGKLVTTKSIASGQMDRISLNFTIMNFDSWPKSRTVTAYAIDPDTARTVLASSVNYHYLQRFGAIMATSFLQGYASAITNSAATTTTGIFGTSTQTPELSPGNRIAVGLGQMGQTLGAVTQNYVNIPPTVRVDSGVGLGILFMADVT